MELVGKMVDMRSWMDYVTFDVMGDLALSKSFGLLDDGTSAYSGMAWNEIDQVQMAHASTQKQFGAAFVSEM